MRVTPKAETVRGAERKAENPAKCCKEHGFWMFFWSQRGLPSMNALISNYQLDLANAKSVPNVATERCIFKNGRLKSVRVGMSRS